VTENRSAHVPDPLAPEMIMRNGRIVTVDERFGIAEALAVQHGRIVAVGSNEEIDGLRGRRTRVLDLQGAAVLPGLNDSHMHLPWFAVSKPPYKLDLSYPNVRSIRDCRRLLAEAVARSKAGQWIIGEGWNAECLDELRADPARVLGKSDLDDIAPDNPVYFIEFSFHNAWVNSRTLESAGIDRHTAAPEGGVIVKDPKSGEPVGLLLEKARDLVERVRPELTREEVKQAVLQNARYLSELGITSITSAAETPPDVAMYSEIATAGRYPVRLNLLLMWAAYGLGGSLADLQEALRYVGTGSGFGNEWVKIGGVKIFADGIPPARTAWVYDAYPDGSHGGLVVQGAGDEERLEHFRRMVFCCHERGFQVAVHACGDRAVDAAVQAFIDALRRKPWDARHYTIHGDWIRPETMRRMAEWRLGHTTQAVIKYSISDTIDRLVGPERSGDQMPLKSLLDAGVVAANSSDAPCASPDWRIGLQYSIVRESRSSGTVSGPHQRLTVQEAIRTYTILPAWLEHAERVKGSIEAGKYADFCILARDITAIDPHEIMRTPILMTIVGGREVYSDGTLAIR